MIAVPHVAVIIPYYQSQAGILAGGLASVFNQSNAPPAHVIIVDDGSPAGFAPELARLDVAARSQVTVIAQSNQGPGPARNAGLSAVPDTAEYIAFLDSDDVWHEHHLARAAAALGEGFDFYFADGDLAGGTTSLFQTLGFNGSKQQQIDVGRDLFGFCDDFLATVLERTPVVTSSVVMRKATLGHLRFPSSRGTCEDLRYWLDVALAAPRVAFSQAIEVTGGRDGVHLSHRGDWKSNKSLQIIYDFMLYHRYVQRNIPLRTAQRAKIVKLAAANRSDFMITALAMLKSGQLPRPSLVAKFLLALVTPSGGAAVTTEPANR